MHNSTFIFVTIFGIGFFHLFQASPIGHVGFSSTVEEEAATTAASNLGTTELAVTTEISES
uniref:Uncharacterized protein n=1 Tax=Panagrolaimus sp. PS1159 TaxID=55785 RepID=A0AC35FU60_9BILA